MRPLSPSFDPQGDQFLPLTHITAWWTVYAFYHARLRRFELHLHLHRLDDGDGLSNLNLLTGRHRQRDQVSSQRRADYQAIAILPSTPDRLGRQRCRLLPNLDRVDAALHFNVIFPLPIFDKEKIARIVQFQCVEWWRPYLLQIYVHGPAIDPHQAVVIDLDLKGTSGSGDCVLHDQSRSCSRRAITRQLALAPSSRRWLFL